jgi:hypothetical protein
MVCADLTCPIFCALGCGSAIASSSFITEHVKGMTLDQAGKVKNTEIAKELSLPPVKLHCSMLAEDAIKVGTSTNQNQDAWPSDTTKADQSCLILPALVPCRVPSVTTRRSELLPESPPGLLLDWLPLLWT